MIVDEFWSLDKEYFYLALVMWNNKGYRLSSVHRYHNSDPVESLTFVSVKNEPDYYYVFEPYDKVILYQGTDLDQVKKIKGEYL